MATLTFFDQYLLDLHRKIHDLDNDTIKYGIVTSTLTPTATTADPRWGAAGTTDLSTNQVTPGGNYSTGGITIANPVTSLDTGAAKFDADDVSLTQHASNPTNGAFGIIYNDTATGKQAIGFVTFDSTIDFSAGDFLNAWHASGLSQLDQA